MVMNPAITQLEVYLDTLENNERVNRVEGNTDEADLQAAKAACVRKSIGILEANRERLVKNAATNVTRTVAFDFEDLALDFAILLNDTNDADESSLLRQAFAAAKSRSIDGVNRAIETLKENLTRREVLVKYPEMK